MAPQWAYPDKNQNKCHIWIHWCYGAWYVGMCWRCVGSVAGWRWVAQPHPAPASAVPGLTALVPHCQPSPVVPRTQACTLHSAGTPTLPCCQYILWGSVCEPSVNQTPGIVQRAIQRGECFFLYFSMERWCSSILCWVATSWAVCCSPPAQCQCMIQKIVVPLIGGGWAAGGVETIDS